MVQRCTVTLMSLRGGGHWWSVPLAAAVVIAVYITTEASLPMVAGLPHGGRGLGACMAFLVTAAGNFLGAISGALLIACRRVLASVVALPYIGGVAVGSLPRCSSRTRRLAMRREAEWSMDEITPEEFFAGSKEGVPIFRRVKDLVDMAGTSVTVRASKSQLAFRRGRHGFAYLWRPGQYLRNPTVEVVLSIALPRQISSDRFKAVVHPAPTVWMHHPEIRSLDDLDDDVKAWLHEASTRAARTP